MIRVGLTGGIGSGKSTAGEIFASLGAIVVDSDQLSRAAIERGSNGFNEVVSHFGDAILKNGDIDRQALGKIIFSDENERIFLESIIHPFVAQSFEEIATHSPADAVVINQIPLLVEVDAASRFDVTIAITASEELRTERLRKRGLSQSEITSRFNAQVSDARREQYCDLVINNDHSRDEFVRHIENVWEESLMPLVRGEITLATIRARKSK